MAPNCLIVVDVQNDFCAGGALEVPGGSEIVPQVNALIANFTHVIMTQDWHPADHLSFASQHPQSAPFANIKMPYGDQTLWPDHCMQGTRGADFHPDLTWTKAELVVRKGFRKEIDSYSAFFENDHKTPTGLTGYLKERGIEQITLAGLALDFCVGFSALDAVAQGFKASVQTNACRAIDLDGSANSMLNRLSQAGVTIA